VVSLTIVFSVLCETAFAATLQSDQSNLISINEYENAMSKIYAQYGIEWKIVDASDAMPITKELFDAEIVRAKNECEIFQAKMAQSKKEIENYQAELNENKSVFVSDSSQIYNETIINSVMPVTKSVRAIYKVDDLFPFASCTLAAYAQFSYDANYGSILNIGYSYIIPLVSINLDQWVDEGSYFSITAGPNAYVVFKGKCYFSYTIPGIEVKTSATIPVYAGVSMS